MDDQRLRRMTEDIVVGHARHRVRTRWAVVAGVLLAVGVAVPASVVLTRGSGSAASSTVAAGRAAPSLRPGVSQTRVSDAAAVYAATLMDRWPSGPVIRVYDRVCDADGVCAAGARTQRLRDDLVVLFGSRIRFQSGPVGAVALQRVSVDGDRATARLEENCGRMCVSGEQVRLSRVDGRWRVVGPRHEWIS